jgi:Xaa-Pro aminopeptidase
MNEIIQSRIENLRQVMLQKGLSAYLINGCDPHLGEYVPARWETRAFISNFTGSYGWLAITLDEAVLWTDSRYYLQSAIELDGSGIEILKARLPETIFIGDWIAARLKPGQKVGFDGSCYSVSECNLLENSFALKGIKIEYRFDLLNEIWDNRPAKPSEKAYLHPLEWAGVSRKEKFSIISSELEKWSAEMTIISSLDDLCWTFNIRGSDVSYNPVVLGFGIVGHGIAKLFVDFFKFSDTDKQELIDDGVDIYPYSSFFSFLSDLKKQDILIDPDRTSYTIMKLLERKNHLKYAMSIPNLLKSRKNEAEISGMKKAMVSDGLALLNFQLWLEKTLGKKKITEYDILQKLSKFRSQIKGSRGDSFYSIVGYKDHGAIVHLHVKREEANVLQKEGVLLFDSGGQYEYGTTDITRTIMLGKVSEQTKIDFTLVLKGMIALSSISFPKGTIGCHLDVLARQAMWKNHMTYGHGTAHGVGACLNVHEGPQSIRLDLNNQPISLGNVMSNEPAFYREGLYGLRTENVMCCVEDTTNEYGEFYRFETLTLYPIDTRLIEKTLLIQDEIDWINQYHQTVFDSLSPFATPEQLNLLMRLTEKIND